MAFDIPLATQFMERMTLAELRIISHVSHKRVEYEATPRTGDRCRLLSLPRELRDLIYHFAAFYHFRDIGIGSTPGLLLTSKQLLYEFQNTLYGTNILSVRYFEDGVWHKVVRSALIEGMLKCRDRMKVDFGGRLLGTQRDQAERLAEFNSDHIDPSARAGVVELVGTDRRSCISVAIARSLISTHAAEPSRQKQLL